MQDKKVNEFVLLPVPLEDCTAAGICEGCILQSYTENGRLIISRVSKEDFICDNDSNITALHWMFRKQSEKEKLQSSSIMTMAPHRSRHLKKVRHSKFI